MVPAEVTGSIFPKKSHFICSRDCISEVTIKMLATDLLASYSEDKKMKSSAEQIPLNSFLCKHTAYYRYSCCQTTGLEITCRNF